MCEAARSGLRKKSGRESNKMGGDVIGLVAVVLTCGIPLALMYTY
jgi:tetrahydromethanopterin S-methyltransferase subunit F